MNLCKILFRFGQGTKKFIFLILAVLLFYLSLAQAEEHEPRKASCSNIFTTNDSLSVAARKKSWQVPIPLDAITMIGKYEPLKDLAVDILEKYNPEDHYFIILGRSPFWFTDILNIVRPGSALTIPLSYRKPISSILFYLNIFAHHVDKMKPYSWGRQSYHEWANKERTETREIWVETPHMRSNLFRLLDHFLIPSQVFTGKKIVLVDYANTGDSLAKFYVDFMAYLDEINHSAQVEALFLDENFFKRDLSKKSNDADHGPRYESMFKEFVVENARWSSIMVSGEKHGLVRSYMDMGDLKGFAPYRKFRMTNKLNQRLPSKRAKHALFLQSMRYHLSKDSSFDQYMYPE